MNLFIEIQIKHLDMENQQLNQTNSCYKKLACIDKETFYSKCHHIKCGIIQRENYGKYLTIVILNIRSQTNHKTCESQSIKQGRLDAFGGLRRKLIILFKMQNYY